ncbi:MAG: HAD family hydrolase [Desulfohalobiaceae bacterium]|nr:HAD family hydrolase [Desulfohalobiaceae bacterium]
MTVRGVVFDCDGVLIDSREANVRFYGLILEQLGLSPMSLQDEDFVHSHTVQESLAHLVPEELLDSADRARKNITYRQVIRFISLEQGIREYLNCLRRAGIPCAVNTNRTDTMDMILEQFGLGSYFHPVVTSRDVNRPKPHPESLRLILDSWGLTPEQVVFIGDSLVDEQAARGAGTLFWSYKNENLSADRYVFDYHEMIRELK